MHIHLIRAATAVLLMAGFAPFAQAQLYPAHRIVMSAVSIPAPSNAVYTADFVGCGQQGEFYTYPCYTLNFALTQVSVGGEVVAQTSGGYGNIAPDSLGNGTLGNITQSVTVAAAPGVYAGLWVPNAGATSALSINAPGGTVTLRGFNLSYQGGGGTVYGIDIIAAAEVNIEDSSITNFPIGIYVEPGVAVNLRVTRSTLRNNTQGIVLSAPAAARNLKISDSTFQADAAGSSSFTGIVAVDGSNTTISGSHFIGLSIGVQASSSANATPTSANVSSSVFSENTVAGLSFTTNGSSGVVTGTLTGNIITDNPGATGLVISGNGASVRLAQNAILDSATGISVANGSVVTYGNNTLQQNTANVTLTGTGAVTTATGF